MSGETIFVFALIGVAAAMMASNRVRFDVVARTDLNASRMPLPMRYAAHIDGTGTG